MHEETEIKPQPTLGQQIRSYRERKGLSLERAALLFELDKRLLEAVESDQAMLSRAMIYAERLGRRVRFAGRRNRKQRVIDLASEAGLSLETTMRLLDFMNQGNHDLRGRDFQMSKVAALAAVIPHGKLELCV